MTLPNEKNDGDHHDGFTRVWTHRLFERKFKQEGRCAFQ
jgi:hypothetical protein